MAPCASTLKIDAILADNVNFGSISKSKPSCLTSGLASPHHGVVLLVGVFTATLSSPGAGIKIPPPLEPKLPDILRSGGNPGEGFTLTASLLTWNADTLTCNRIRLTQYCILDLK